MTLTLTPAAFSFRAVRVFLLDADHHRLVFLPPYSPDLNPIELAFAPLKGALRTDGHREVPQLMTFLRSAGAIFRPDECRAYIRHCGYGKPATPPPN